MFLNTIKSIVLVVISFIATIELITAISPSENLLRESDKVLSFLPDPTAKSVLFIGDSFAATSYIENSYARQFEAFFEDKNLHFLDLASPGTDLKDHLNYLDSVKLTHTHRPELMIYYYNISDVVSFVNGDIVTIADEEERKLAQKVERLERKRQKKGRLGTILKKSNQVVKDVLQQLSLKATGHLLPGSPISMAPKYNVKYQNELREIFNSFEAEHTIILVNTPFHYGENAKYWEHYELLNTMALNDNISLLHTVDIIPDEEYALSWRNGHPNQEAIDIIAARILLLADEVLNE